MAAHPNHFRFILRANIKVSFRIEAACGTSCPALFDVHRMTGGRDRSVTRIVKLGREAA
jgi:ribosomal protein S3AE